MIVALAVAICICATAFALLLLRVNAKRRGDDRMVSAYFPALFCAWIFSSVFFNSYFYAVRPFNVIDITVERVLYILIVLSVGVIVIFGKKRFQGNHLTELFLFAFLCICVASMSVHGFSAQEPGEPKPWFTFFESYFVPFSAFVFMKYFLDDEKAVKLFMLTLLWIGAYISVLAFLEHYGMHRFIYPQYIADPRYTLHQDRARGPLLNAAFNGMALCYAATAALFLWPYLGLAGRLGTGFLFLLLFPSIFFTQTRSAYLTFALVLITAFVFLRTRGDKWKLYPMFAAIFLVLVVLNANRLTSESRAAGGLAQGEEVSIRFDLIKRSLRLMTQSPVFGVGLARFSVVGVVPGAFQEQQHNHLVGLAVELGMVGALAYLAILSAIFARLFALARTALIETKFYANVVLLLALGLTIYLVTNVFVEPSFCPFGNIVAFSLAGLVDRMADRPDFFAQTAKALG